MTGHHENCMFCDALLPIDQPWFFPPPGTLALREHRFYGQCCRDLADDTDWVMAE